MSAVSIKGVSKKYQILRSQRAQLRKVLSFGKAKAGREFWALKDINLEVKPGTALGIIGRNGAGKTTLLQTISGVLQPTSGTVRVNGRLVALFTLGVGFEDQFTGRENVMLNGLILGLDRKEMLERFDEIADFADVGDFMDQPLKTYSNGMRARLGFAVAVSVEPDILLVDETLATGDEVFRAKGIQKMRELRDSGTTILFVSHSTDQVRNFCTEAALLHEGSLVAHGDAIEVIDHYHALLSKAVDRLDARFGLQGAPAYETTRDGKDEVGPPEFEANPTFEGVNPSLRHDTGEARVQKVELLDDHGKRVDVVTPGEELTVRVHAQYVEDLDDSVIVIALRNLVGLDVFSTSTTLEKAPLGKRRAGERLIVDFTFPVPLKHGRYAVVAAVSHPESKELYLNWVGTSARFKIPYQPDRGAFPSLVHLPTQVEIFEPDKTR
jgi:ABC-2 type transport system ATP-binding protein